MDTLAHGIIASLTGRSFRSQIDWRWLFFFGMLPDLIWLPFTVLSVVTSGHLTYFWGPYNISHSLVVWVLVSGLASIKWRRTFVYTWPYALHLLVDIPGHIDMPTPILWPISHWHITGWFDWLHWPIWFGTYAVFGLWLLLIKIQKEKPLRIKRLNGDDGETTRAS